VGGAIARPQSGTAAMSFAWSVGSSALAMKVTCDEHPQ
jgi:hypothetical protein